MLRRTLLMKWKILPTNLCRQASGSYKPATYRVLGIETSADDACVALVDYDLQTEKPNIVWQDRRSCDLTKHGGIHPVEAVRSHTINLPIMLRNLKKWMLPDPEKGDLAPKVDLIAVTRGPGMGGCLSVGFTTAKALYVHKIITLRLSYGLRAHGGQACVWDIKFIGVHHMQAHALTPLMGPVAMGTSESDSPQYPFLTLLASGKHTMLVYTKSHISHRILASTPKSIALGDVLDKVARSTLPEQKESQEGQPRHYPREMFEFVKDKFEDYDASRIHEVAVEIRKRWGLAQPLQHTAIMEYNFTSLLGSVLNLLQEQPHMGIENRRDLAWSAMKLAFEHVASRVIMALQYDEELRANPPKTLVMSGGVSSSPLLRLVVKEALKKNKYDVSLACPEPAYCTDNAAMIAHTGFIMAQNGWQTADEAHPQVKWSIEEIISGVGGWSATPDVFAEQCDAATERENRE